jgi:hypothetical protein
MAHRYKELIRVDVEPMAEPGHGLLHAFTWRGVRLRVPVLVSSGTAW